MNKIKKNNPVFPDNKYPFMKEISVISRYGHIFLKNNLKDYDLGSGQFMHLMVLYKNPNINQEALSKIINIDKGTTAKTIKTLLENEYITRTPSENDKRSYDIHLTEKALLLKEEIHKIKKKWNDIILTDISDDEFNQFKLTLNKISENTINYYEENRCTHGK